MVRAFTSGKTQQMQGALVEAQKTRIQNERCIYALVVLILFLTAVYCTIISCADLVSVVAGSRVRVGI
jgi:t-SNARE complex subunit (syntaxin)